MGHTTKKQLLPSESEKMETTALHCESCLWPFLFQVEKTDHGSSGAMLQVVHEKNDQTGKDHVNMSVSPNPESEAKGCAK